MAAGSTGLSDTCFEAGTGYIFVHSYQNAGIALPKGGSEGLLWSLRETWHGIHAPEYIP